MQQIIQEIERGSDLIPQKTKAKVIKLYNEPIPYLVNNIENKFEFDLFNQNTYQKFEPKILISIWNKIKFIRVRGKKSILFEEAKNIFLSHLKKNKCF